MSAPAIDLSRSWGVHADRSPAGGTCPPGLSRRRPGPQRPAPAGRMAAAVPSRATVRLTSRGRAVLAAAFLLAGLLGSVPAVVGDAPGAAAPSPAAGAEPAAVPGAALAELGLARPYTVATGDSLWSIAAATGLADDPRRVVDRIAELSGLTDARLVPGQQLWVPVRESRVAADGRP